MKNLIVFFDNNKISIDQLREQILVATRQYAKRQRTWFRKRMAAWTNVDAEKLWQL